MYKLGTISHGTLFRDIQSWWALKRGKEDPHARIGADKYDGNETDFWALKNLNFEIKQGDRLGIIGKNGAGKSTLLKVLSQITTPTEGSAKIRGRVSSLLEVGTGFHGELTGRENIYLNGAILGMKKREVDKKLDEIIAFSGIDRHIDTPVKRYSSGMYVRLAFAVAAHLDSDILIADEVLAVGDAEFQKKAIGKMSDLSTSEGRTILFVSHNMAAVRSLCDKGMVLEKGWLKFQSDSIDETVEEYLGIRDTTNAPSIWENDGSIESPYFTPEWIQLVDCNDNIQHGTILYESEYKIILNADIQEIIPNIDFWILIYTESRSIFALKGINDKLHVGKNCFEFNLYPRMLPPGKYELSLSLSIKNTKWIVDPDEHRAAISFSVVSPNSSLWEGKQLS